MVVAIAEQTAPNPATLATFFTRKTLASYLQFSTAALDRHNILALIPRPIKLGKSLRWHRQEILDWVAAGGPPRAEWEARRKAAR
jgi:predicted DNA-binding transcriptional regulator AlpA